MEEEHNAPPPFWLQSSNSPHQVDYNRRRRLSRASSFLLNSSAFLIVLLVIVLCFILIVIPKFVQFASQLLRPQSVKKSWDSLNLVLVLFAIVCGFLSRNTGDDNKGSFEDRSVSSKPTVKSNPSTPRRWYGYSDDRPTHYTVNRMRSSSSYPDLRLQESSSGAGDERWRFYDDTDVPNHRLPASDQLHRHREDRLELEHEDLDAKSVGFDRSEIREEVYSQPAIPSPPQSPPPRVSPPRSPSPPPTPPPPAKTPKPIVVKRRPKRTHKVHTHTPDGEIDQQHNNGDSDVADFQRIQLPPLSPPSFYQESEQKSSKNEKKRGGTTKEFWTALRRRKKKQRQKSIESFETIITSQRPSTSSLPPPSPPPPPPLPPPSVLQNLFSSKKGKGKKGQSVPPPEPPPPSIASSEPKPETEVQNQLSKPTMELERLSSLNDEEYNTRTGGESPFHPIPPPPPPPPPFKTSDWKFVRHGDFVSIGSNSSTPRAVSPDMDESEADGPPATSERRLVKDSTTPMFCSSPDVNSKADNFIARFRADLKLQKMNSIKEKKARKRSNLGRERSPGPE